MEDCLKMFHVIFSRMDDILSITQFYKVDDCTQFDIVVPTGDGSVYVNVTAVSKDHAIYKANRCYYSGGKL